LLGIHLEDIVDDELLLPDTLPGVVKYKGIKRKSSSGKERDWRSLKKNASRSAP